MGQDLRGFLQRLEAERPDHLVRVKEPLDAKYEVSAVVEELNRLPTAPVLFAEQVVGSSFPLVSNLLADRDRIAYMLGVPREGLISEFTARAARRIAPVEHGDAPWREQAFEGKDLDCGRLPIPTHLEQDGGPYLTACLVVARDPVLGVHTIGHHRMMLKGPRKLGISLHSRRRMWEYFRKAEELKQDLPAAVILGVHPLISLGASVFPPPPDMDKYDAVGGMLGEPLEVARVGDLDVWAPRWAEIVIEGRILHGVREPEGPLGEFTGYASGRGTENLFEPIRLWCRHGAIFQNILAGMSAEHCLLCAFPREALVTNILRRTIPTLHAVHVPLRTTGAFVCLVSLKKTMEGQARQAILATLGADHYFKVVVVVDEDVDVFDVEQVLWAVATRAQADRDFLIVSDAPGTLLDPSARVAEGSQHPLTGKVGIDATKPLSGFASTLSLPGAARERARAVLRAVSLPTA
jgi:UbiD family decarboxylase